MIEVTGLSKRYGEKLAVDDLTFKVDPGIVTGFLGPNGAGKSTTMRMILGLDAPTAGTATVNGMAYRDAKAPLREVGALLEARSIHTGRSAFNHLLALAQTNGIPRSRVEEVVDMVGLREVAKKQAGGFSLGMGQRLGIASALLGDPSTVILDEPVNGLDPEGILWIRNLLKYLASEGRTVFVSSHLMSEMALTAEHLIVIGKGKLIADTSVEDFISGSSAKFVVVRSPQLAEAQALVQRLGGTSASDEDGGIKVEGITSEAIGEGAAAAGIVLHELSPQRASLEEVFMEMTHDSVEYQGQVDAPASTQAQGVQQ